MLSMSQTKVSDQPGYRHRISAVMVLGMLCASFMFLFSRWVLFPLRYLATPGFATRGRGGSFDYKINLQSGDEMQDLAGAFNDMTAKISMKRYADLDASRSTNGAGNWCAPERLAGVGFLAATGVAA